MVRLPRAFRNMSTSLGRQLWSSIRDVGRTKQGMETPDPLTRSLILLLEA